VFWPETTRQPGWPTRRISQLDEIDWSSVKRVSAHMSNSLLLATRRPGDSAEAKLSDANAVMLIWSLSRHE
jgi:hypothetical protein